MGRKIARVQEGPRTLLHTPLGNNALPPKVPSGVSLYKSIGSVSRYAFVDLRPSPYACPFTTQARR